MSPTTRILPSSPRLLRHKGRRRNLPLLSFKGRERQPRQSPFAARQRAFGVARHAGAAYFGPHGIDDAGGFDPDPPRQRRTAVAVAAHAGLSLVDELCRNEVERRVVFGRKTRPVMRIGAAGAAGLARTFGFGRRLAGFHHHISLGASHTRLRRHFARSRSRRSGYFSSR